MPMHHVVVRWIAWRWAIGPGQERLSPAGRPSPTPTWAWRGPGCRPLTGTHHRTRLAAHTPPLGSEVPAQGNQRVGGGSLPYAASARRGGQPAAVWPDR